MSHYLKLLDRTLWICSVNKQHNCVSLQVQTTVQPECTNSHMQGQFEMLTKQNLLNSVTNFQLALVLQQNYRYTSILRTSSGTLGEKHSPRISIHGIHGTIRQQGSTNALLNCKLAQ